LVAERRLDGQDKSLDRSRANRDTDLSPELLPLLRGPGNVCLSSPEYDDDQHVGAPMLGIFVAAALSIPLWCAVILAAQALIG
jgi:hypothetical protein